jgi:hypothetical protein
MILDMIQCCRYLRRSTDRWFLSKNSTTRLKDSMFGTGPVLLCRCSIPIIDIKGLYLYSCPNTTRPVLLCRCSIPIIDIKGLYLYSCPNTTPGRLRVQHLMFKLMLRRQCPSHIRHQLVPSLYRATSPRIPENSLLKAQTVPLPNDSTLPTASILCRILWEDFPSRMVFRHQTRPTSQPLSSTNFGVNTNSTQKTSLLGEDCPHLYVVLPHHQFPMWD